jgi:hypothetical protein
VEIIDMGKKSLLNEVRALEHKPDVLSIQLTFGSRRTLLFGENCTTEQYRAIADHIDEILEIPSSGKNDILRKLSSLLEAEITAYWEKEEDQF